MFSKSELKNEYVSWIKSFIIALGLALIIRTFFFSPVMVDGASMEPTLHHQEKMLVTKTIGWVGEVHRGDIVIINTDDPKLSYVKRIVGLPRDVIEMRDDQLFINNVLVKEPYLECNKTIAHLDGRQLTEDFGPIMVPDDHYFVMGDNRFRSRDSRNELGFIEADRIIGKSKFVFFPLKNARVLQ
ncbi:signal peptidase I [Pseudogracilibacillus auburnensis]|uniref:signal peptidase I n=1 Tax=Pseudogracilibacillus auburnensis TaxID=1494959 RepID=UPI001A96DC18|nr:signal peptidase I [Pseudogracilibacillus auburnensis]MBO1005096.1 signal peptidase I [Pseudogracilibacillus auburnensis]